MAKYSKSASKKVEKVMKEKNAGTLKSGRSGKKVTSKRLLYPGYVVVQMDMNDELWHRVKDTPRVTGFVGGGTTPVPLSADLSMMRLYFSFSP